MARLTHGIFASEMAEAIPTYDICTIKQDTFASDELLVSRFSTYLKTRHTLRKPHRHTFYHLVFFTEGSGQHTIDFQNFTVKPGEIYFMKPGQVHSWNFKTEPEGYVVNFSETFFRSFLLDHRFLDRYPFFSGVAEDGVVFLGKAAQQQMVVLFEQMMQAIQVKDEHTQVLVKLLLLQAFILTTRNNKQNTKPHATGNMVVRGFQNLVDEKYLQLRLPKDYAALLFVTPNYLNSLCVKNLGISAGDVIRNRVQLEAKRLLVNAGLTISQIAYQLNFTDHSHFSKFFKKSTGQSPEDFRKSHLEIV